MSGWLRERWQSSDPRGESVAGQPCTVDDAVCMWSNSPVFGTLLQQVLNGGETGSGTLDSTDPV